MSHQLPTSGQHQQVEDLITQRGVDRRTMHTLLNYAPAFIEAVQRGILPGVSTFRQMLGVDHRNPDFEFTTDGRSVEEIVKKVAPDENSHSAGLIREMINSKDGLSTTTNVHYRLRAIRHCNVGPIENTDELLNKHGLVRPHPEVGLQLLDRWSWEDLQRMASGNAPDEGKSIQIICIPHTPIFIHEGNYFPMFTVLSGFRKRGEQFTYEKAMGTYGDCKGHRAYIGSVR
jgi:hypothetical protein